MPGGCEVIGTGEKKALVTGASRGIGQAISNRLLEAGYQVVGLARDQSKLIQVKEASPGPERFEVLVADLTQPEQLIRKLRSSLDERLDLLVNNAGLCRQAPYTDEETWNEVMDVNLDGVFRVTRELGPELCSGGSVVNIASGLGKNGRENFSAYSASKHGLIGFTRSLARELAPEVRVNAVCPGWVDTEMARADVSKFAREADLSEAEMREKIEAEIPLERFVQPREVADLVVFLASDRASAITGQAYNISCGELS